MKALPAAPVADWVLVMIGAAAASVTVSVSFLFTVPWLFVATMVAV